jgi:hypothetical protein
VSIVAECTNTLTVATAIYNKKTIGCFTNGTTTVPVVDATTGVTEDISFYQPTNLPIYILAVLTGYGNVVTSAILQSVQTALVNYLNALAIGEVVSIGALYYEIMSVNLTLTTPTFGVQSLQVGTGTAATTGSFTASVSSITVASIAGIVNGQLVAGNGIAPGTIVTAASGVTVVLSRATTDVETDTPLVFSSLTSTDEPMPNFYYSAQGITENVSVVSA